MIIFLGNSHSLELYKDIIEKSKKDSPDIVVSCQYPHKIPESLIRSHICVNIHYGKLPQFAGCNPVYWQIMLDSTAGITLHYMDENFDSGDIIEIKEIPCGSLTADECYEALTLLGRDVFYNHYQAILKGKAKRTVQDHTKRRYFHKTDINFEYGKYVYALDDKSLRALNFEGKQAPIIKVGERQYKVEAI